MKVISGLDKARKLGGEIENLNGNGYCINMKMRKDDINLAEFKKLSSKINCSKCNVEMPYVMAMFDVDTDEAYCYECCGYAVNSDGETVELEDSDIDVSFEDGFKTSVTDEEATDICFTKSEVKLLHDLTSSAITGLIEHAFKSKVESKADFLERNKLNKEILKMIKLEFKLSEILGQEIPEVLKLAAKMLKTNIASMEKASIDVAARKREKNDIVDFKDFIGKKNNNMN